MLDPVVLRFATVNFLYLGPLYAFNLSAPTLLSAAAHLDATHVGYLTAFAGLLGAGAMLLNGWASDRRGERYVHLVAPLVTLGLAYGAMSLTASPLLICAAYVVAVLSNMAISAVCLAGASAKRCSPAPRKRPKPRDHQFAGSARLVRLPRALGAWRRTRPAASISA